MPCWELTLQAHAHAGGVHPRVIVPVAILCQAAQQACNAPRRLRVPLLLGRLQHPHAIMCHGSCVIKCRSEPSLCSTPARGRQRIPDNYVARLERGLWDNGRCSWGLASSELDPPACRRAAWPAQIYVNLHFQTNTAAQSSALDRRRENGLPRRCCVLVCRECMLAIEHGCHQARSYEQ